jgi:glycosyltransferase involved in cell wall biosynthesis
MKILFLIEGQGKAQDTMYEWATFFKPANMIAVNDPNKLGKDIDLVLAHSLNFNILKARSSAPKSKIFVIDPRLESSQDKINVSMCDMVICGSLEQQDFCLKFNLNSYFYPWINLKNPKVKKSFNLDPVISYHGNLIHLNASKDTLMPALNVLSYKYNFVFKPIYNIEKLGMWRVGRPLNVNIVDTQWDENTYYQELTSSDIGVVPNYIPTKLLKKFSNIFRSANYNLNPKDYLIRYKFQSNANRIYDYMELGVPIVAENYPSSSYYIRHGVNGFLVQSYQGWTHYLEQLLVNPDLRRMMGDLSKEEFIVNLNFIKILNEFCNHIKYRYGLNILK